MQTLHFILGGGMTEKQWSDLGVAVTSFYTSRIAMPFTVAIYRWTDDVFSMIQQSQPTGPLTIVGHSYGGHKVVKTAAQFAAVGRVVDHAVLFDPVAFEPPDAYLRPNTTGFALTGNVAEAVCFYRGAKEQPFSGQIASGPNYLNVSWPGQHGDSVWCGVALGYVGKALAGNSMLPVKPPAPPPVPSKAKKLVSVVLNYDDGTQETTYPK